MGTTGKIRFEPQSLVIEGAVQEDELVDKLNTYLEADASLPWYVGDLTVYHAAQFGDTLHDRLQLDNLTSEKQKQAEEVSMLFRPHERVNGLLWEHHRAVIKVANKKRRHQFLKQAQAEGLTSRQLARIVNKHIKEAKEALAEKQEDEPDLSEPEQPPDKVVESSRNKVREALRVITHHVGNLPRYNGEMTQHIEALKDFVG